MNVIKNIYYYLVTLLFLFPLSTFAQSVTPLQYSTFYDQLTLTLATTSQYWVTFEYTGQIANGGGVDETLTKTCKVFGDSNNLTCDDDAWTFSGDYGDFLFVILNNEDDYTTCTGGGPTPAFTANDCLALVNEDTYITIDYVEPIIFSTSTVDTKIIADAIASSSERQVASNSVIAFMLGFLSIVLFIGIIRKNV